MFFLLLLPFFVLPGGFCLRFSLLLAKLRIPASAGREQSLFGSLSLRRRRSAGLRGLYGTIVFLLSTFGSGGV